jgi:hypothetical protein
MPDEKPTVAQRIFTNQDPKRRLLTVPMIEHVLDTLAALPPEDGVNRAEFEITGTDADFEITDGLGGLSLDALYELHRMIQDTDVTRLKVTLEWEGTY